MSKRKYRINQSTNQGKNNTANYDAAPDYEGVQMKGDSTHPLFWLTFAMAYIGLAVWAIYSYFTSNPIYTQLGLACAIMLPAGFIVSKLLKGLGVLQKPRQQKSSRLGELLYAPALIIPAAIIGVPVYHFLHYPVMMCFLTTSAALTFIVLMVDTCLNLFREQFTKFFVYLYKLLYLVVVEFFIIKILYNIVFKCVIAPIARALGRAWMKLMDAFIWIVGKLKDACVWLFTKVIAPTVRFIVNRMVVPFFKFIGRVLKAFYNHVLVPFVNFLAKLARATCKYIIKPTIKFLVRLAKAFYRYVILSIVRFVRFVVSNVKKMVVGLCVMLRDYVIVPVVKCTKKAAETVAKKVIKPVLLFIYNNVILKFIELMGDLSEFLFDHVFVPFFKFLSRVPGWLANYVFKPIYRYVIKPICKMLKAIGNFIFKYILRPIWKVLVAIGKAIYNYFLKYVFKVIQMQCRLMADVMKTLFGWVFNDANGVVNYFITIPLIILSIVGGVVYYFWF